MCSQPQRPLTNSRCQGLHKLTLFFHDVCACAFHPARYDQALAFISHAFHLTGADASVRLRCQCNYLYTCALCVCVFGHGCFALCPLFSPQANPLPTAVFSCCCRSLVKAVHRLDAHERDTSLHVQLLCRRFGSVINSALVCVCVCVCARLSLWCQLSVRGTDGFSVVSFLTSLCQCSPALDAFSLMKLWLGCNSATLHSN